MTARGFIVNPEEVKSYGSRIASNAMVLFTTLVPMASGAFVGLALAFLTSRFSKECLARIDRWTLLPMAILAVGYIASFVALSSPQYSMSLVPSVDIAPLSFVGIAGMLFIALAWCTGSSR